MEREYQETAFQNAVVQNDITKKSEHPRRGNLLGGGGSLRQRPEATGGNGINLEAGQRTEASRRSLGTFSAPGSAFSL